MNPSLSAKLEQLAVRAGEIHALLSQPAVIGDQPRFRALSRELADITPTVDAFANLRACNATLDEARAMLEDADGDIRKLAQEEVRRATDAVAECESALHKLLLPRDPNDERNIFLEIRAGTGGDEAAIFCGDLFRMYQAYAERRRWRVEVLSTRHGEHGGYKEIISRIVGRGAYSQLKFESGAHRVQRVPQTETQGRIHTSACTVAVLPEVDAVTGVEINSRDLRVDTYRASGAGGQHVNRTDSAVRITHLPSGIVVECQDERSQHKNRARAMSVLRARLVAAERKAQRDAEAETRRTLVGSGDRSERIRTYNFPQGRVTDHRIGLTLYKLDSLLAGDLDALLAPLAAEHQAEVMAASGD